MTKHLQDLRVSAATDAPSRTAFTGAYSSTAHSPWGDRGWCTATVSACYGVKTHCVDQRSLTANPA